MGGLYIQISFETPEHRQGSRFHVVCCINQAIIAEGDEIFVPWLADMLARTFAGQRLQADIAHSKIPHFDERYMKEQVIP